MRKVISLALAFLMTVSLFVPMLSVSAETNEEIEATVSTYNLVALMNRGDKLLEEYDFSEESLASYKKAYDKALEVLFYGKTQAEVDNAKAELESAINVLSAQIETTTAPAPIYRLAGDVNEDDKVNVRDATAIQKHLANIVTLSSIGVVLADANGDGKLNIKDATEVQKFIAGLTISDVIGEKIEIQPNFTESTTLNTDTTENIDVTTEVIPTTVPVITTEPTEILSTEVTEVTETTTIAIFTDPTEEAETSAHTEVTNNEENVADGAISFTLAEEFRVEYYGSEKTELYLVKSREEMANVIAKIQNSCYSSLYTTPTISEKYNDEFFENNALIISLNCVGGSNCYQTIDSLDLDGDTLTVCRTLYKPDIVLTDMNYRYALLEVSANAVKNVKNLEDNVTYATIGDDVTVPDKYEGETAIYFTNTQNWTKVYIHFWGGEYDTIWPGVEMDFVENNPYGQDVFKAYIPADTTGIVFSAGVNMPQTVDIISSIIDGYGFYPTETDNGKWKVESYIYESKNEETTDATKPTTIPTIPQTTVPKDIGNNGTAIDFEVKEECRVEYYGSEDAKLYIVRNVAEFKAVLDTIQSSFGDYYQKPAISDEYDDLYFMSNALVISLSCVGGSNCYQTIDGISVNGNTLALHRSLYKPDIVLCDMNYQYVLIEVNANEIRDARTAVYSNSDVRITE